MLTSTKILISSAVGSAGRAIGLLILLGNSSYGSSTTVINVGAGAWNNKSSILVYLFLQHVVHICSTWMTSCVQFEKNEG